MSEEGPLTFEGRSEANSDHALHVAAEEAAAYAKKNGLSFRDREFMVVSTSIVLSNPHIKEFRVRIEG